MRLGHDYEIEIQFHFQLEIVPSRQRAVNKLKMQDCNGKGYGMGDASPEPGARPIPLVNAKVCFRQLAKQGCTPVAATSGHQWTRSDSG
jgi:hypothetical protein